MLYPYPYAVYKVVLSSGYMPLFPRIVQGIVIQVKFVVLEFRVGIRDKEKKSLDNK